MNNELLLLSNNDIPFIEAQISIHNPTIKEISMVGEEGFFSGCKFLCFSKNQLSAEDRIGLENRSDFEVFMSIIQSKPYVKYKNYVVMLLALLFPQYQVKFTPAEILLLSKEGITRINNINFEPFKNILNKMFDLEDSSASGDYNPIDARAAKIAEKLKKRKQQLSKAKGEDTEKVAIFSRYVSILAVGEQKDINQLMNYTVFQLKDEFTRFQKKQSFDAYMQARLAGAQNLDEVDNWMDNIHS